MKLNLLNIHEIKQVYETRMVIDFPKAELKPLKTIIEAVNSGIYECLGLFDGDECIGYTFLIKQKRLSYSTKNPNFFNSVKDSIYKN